MTSEALTSVTPTSPAQRSEQDLLLVAALAEQRAAREAEVRLLARVVEFAIAHPPIDGADRCLVKVAENIEGRPVTAPLNGEGVPEVSALAVAQLGATLGLSPTSGRMLVAESLELAYRLPGLWERVRAGAVPAWQARRVAKATLGLARLAARFVDRHLHGLAGAISVRSLDLLVAEAVARYDVVRERQRIREVSDRRRFQIEFDRCDLLGQVPVYGLLALPDALALDAALTHAAQQLAASGSAETQEVLRSRALGDLAREHLVLGGGPPPPTAAVYDDVAGTLTPVPVLRLVPSGPGEAPPAATPILRAAARRELMLHVHVTDRELIAALRTPGRGAPMLGRVEHGKTGDLPITAATIRNWCGAVGTRITVQPVLDLAGRVHHDAYEIPERLREQVRSRDHTCVYPGCQVPARRCDLDHVVGYDHTDPTRGGPTATENLACLCRRHHNLKTAGRISYEVTGPGEFTWDLGTGERFVRDHRGTRREPPEP